MSTSSATWAEFYSDSVLRDCLVIDSRLSHKSEKVTFLFMTHVTTFRVLLRECCYAIIIGSIYQEDFRTIITHLCSKTLFPTFNLPLKLLCIFKSCPNLS